VLKPLDYFRNVKNVTLRDADLDDTPNVIDEEISIVGLLSHFTDYPGLQDELATRMAKPEIIELTCQMYARLLRYARAFERNDDIKMQMALSAEERGESLSNELYCGRLLDGQPCDPHSLFFAGSPYRTQEEAMHPVETYLALANAASKTDDDRLFKSFRKEVLNSVEEPYQQISVAAGQIAEYVKEKEKFKNLFFNGMPSVGVIILNLMIFREFK
jgi:hypothetical protein